MVKDTGGPAFPINRAELPNGESIWPEPGMTLRDYFAAKAMQGMVSAKEIESYVGNVHCTALADRAYNLADAMLEARK